MNKYVESLNLNFDPFDADTGFSHFYEGGNRDYLLDQLIQQSYYGGAITVVTAALGSGKSTLAHWFRQSLDEDAITIMISASLFMTRSQLLENICEQLAIDCSDPLSDGELLAAIEAECAELKPQSQYLQLVVDDAHELGRDVMQVITDLYLNKDIDNFHFLLLGEKQLGEMLDTLLPINTLDDSVVRYGFDEFIAEEVAEYITFKLSAAGYASVLPLSPDELSTIHGRSNGVPGAVNMLTVTQLNRQFSGAAAEIQVADQSIQAEQGTRKPTMTLPVLAKYLGAASVLGLALFFAVSFTGNEGDLDQLEAGLTSTEPATGRVQIPVGPATSVYPAGQLPSLSRRESADSLENNKPTVKIAEGDVPPVEDISEFGALSDLQEQTLATAQDLVRGQPIPILPDEVQAADAEQLSGEASEQHRSVVEAQATIADPGPIPILAESEPIAAAAVEPSPVQIAQTAPEQVPEPDVEEVVETSGYAQRILAYQPQNYTLQLLGSFSEASAQKFIAENAGSDGYAYFETRHQSRPWFVVVYGSFPDRSAATAAIASLPAAHRALEPWVRSLVSVQEDIRKYWVQAN